MRRKDRGCVAGFDILKFTILSHAGMLVEHQGTSVLIDPWLRGSCYWRSWWNFPEPDKELIEDLKPDFVYITHLHWDHFHGASLRRFNPDTRILVPKAITTRMVDDLRWLGFSKITEITHGGSIRLNSDFKLHSFQFDTSVDSSVVLEGGGITLLDANDCKYFGLPLQALLRRFPSIDFVFRSHSSASPLPYCIDGYQTKFPELRTAEDYEEEFSRFAIYCGTRYAVPFASNHCFLHKETRHFNATAVTPHAAANRCDALALSCGAKTRAVVMPAGSSWEQGQGFSLAKFDYAEREKYVDKLLLRYSPKLEEQYRVEAEECADFASFEHYFRGLLNSTPWIVRRSFGSEIAFRVKDKDGERYWIVNFGRKTIREAASPQQPCIVIETAAKILNDCTRIKMFSVWTPSKRLKLFLETERQRRDLLLLFRMLDLWELECLPLRKLLRPRAIAVIAHRWREGLEYIRQILKIVVLRRSFVYRDVYPLPVKTTT
jgi:UDP-MurNAc hydroxylase